jgi:hypothetical protein
MIALITLMRGKLRKAEVGVGQWLETRAGQLLSFRDDAHPILL